MTPLPRHFGRYALFDFLAKGGMAEIYLARVATELGAARLCVVKQILGELASDPDFSAMLTHEAKLAARLSHANIVQVFDLGREADQLYIAMEYVEGFDLNALLRRCSKAKVALPVEFALRIVSDALRGLDYAHRRDVVHRDVSPSNVLVSFEGEVKLCDFGIAHASDLAPRGVAAVDRAIQGKAGYMSPERARGEAIDARADVFAAGILLWELLAGRRMYRVEEGGPSLLDIARDARIPALPLRGFPGERALHEVLRGALAVERGARTASAGTMLKELEAAMLDARMLCSPLRLGEWLVETFGEDIAAVRRAQEHARAALEAQSPVASRPSARPAPAASHVAAGEEALGRAPHADGPSSAGAQSRPLPGRPSDILLPAGLDAPSLFGAFARERAPQANVVWVLLAAAVALGTVLLVLAR